MDQDEYQRNWSTLVAVIDKLHKIELSSLMAGERLRFDVGLAAATDAKRALENARMKQLTEHAVAALSLLAPYVTKLEDLAGSVQDVNQLLTHLETIFVTCIAIAVTLA